MRRNWILTGPRGGLQDEETALHVSIEDAIPNHAGGAAGERMLEFDNLASMQGPVAVGGAEAAPAVIEQIALQDARHGIVEAQRDGSGGRVAFLGAALSRFRKRRIHVRIRSHTI